MFFFSDGYLFLFFSLFSSAIYFLTFGLVICFHSDLNLMSGSEISCILIISSGVTSTIFTLGGVIVDEVNLNVLVLVESVGGSIYWSFGDLVGYIMITILGVL